MADFFHTPSAASSQSAVGNTAAMSAAQPDLSIRGFNRELSNKVLILVDGRSVYWDFIGTTFWSTLPVAMSEIERVEVIRGPGSAVYGANAMTGVVNIITKAPGSEPGTRLQLTGGYPDLSEGYPDLWEDALTCRELTLTCREATLTCQGLP